MRAVLYVFGCVLMATTATGMAFLPRIAPTPLSFAIVGAVLSVLIPASWLLLSATAGSWPRPRAGHILMAVGILAILFGLRDMQWAAAGWAVYVTAVGIGVTWVPRSCRTRSQEQDDSPSNSVQAPIGRRA